MPPSCTQVCDLWDSFGSREASAVCRQLGLPLPGRSVGGSYWGASSSSPVLDWRPGPGLGCNGTEATLAEVRRTTNVLQPCETTTWQQEPCHDRG